MAGKKKSYKPKKKAYKRSIPRKLMGYARLGGAYGRFRPGGELKFFDTSLSFAADATGEVPATGQLNLIPQGVTESTRVGRLALIKSIQINGLATFVPSTAATAAVVAYIYLVMDTQCNGAAAGVTDVLTSTDLSVALPNINNSMRFRILKKFVLPLNAPAGATTAYNNVQRPFTLYKRCSIPIDFSSTTGAITEIRSNNLFLIAGMIGADDTVSVTGTVRLRFADE